MPMKSDSSLVVCDSVGVRTVPLSRVASSYSALAYFNPLDLAWAGGIVDGEGCIHIKRDKATATSKHKTDHYALLLLVTMIERDTIQQLRDMFDVGHVYEHKPPGSRMTYRWQCYPRDAAYVICLILPFLRNKREQALAALRFVDLGTGRHGQKRADPALVAQREAMYWELREAKRA
jgi:hypothetical protein